MSQAQLLNLKAGPNSTHDSGLEKDAVDSSWKPMTVLNHQVQFDIEMAYLHWSFSKNALLCFLAKDFRFDRAGADARTGWMNRLKSSGETFLFSQIAQATPSNYGTQQETFYVEASTAIK